METPRASSVLALLAGVSAGVVALGARVHWGFGREILSGLMLPWIALCLITPQLLVRGPYINKIPLRLACFSGAAVSGGYMAAGYPEYFTRNAYYAIGAGLAWLVLICALFIASCLAAAAMAVVASLAVPLDAAPSVSARGGGGLLVSRFVQGATALILGLSIGEILFTRFIETGYAVTYFAGGPPSPTPPLGGAAPFQFAMAFVCLVAIAVLTYRACRKRREAK